MSNDAASVVAKKPSIGAYIGAWILAAIASRVASALLETVLGKVLVQSRDDLAVALFIIPVGSYTVTLAIWVGIYSGFKSLNIGKVIPYIWVFGILGILLSIVQVNGEFARYNFKIPVTYYVGLIGGFVAFAYLFSAYFKRKGRVY